FLVALLLSTARLRAITSASHLRMLPAHLSVTRAHLGITRHLIHRMRPMTGATCGSGSLAGMHFGLVSPSGPHVAVISGLELVPVCSSLTRSCPLEITFSYVPGFVSTFSSSCCSSESLSTLSSPRARVFSFACTGSTCGAGSLCAPLALSHPFVLVELFDRVGVRFPLVHGSLEITILRCCLLPCELL